VSHLEFHLAVHSALRADAALRALLFIAKMSLITGDGSAISAPGQPHGKLGHGTASGSRRRVWEV
jgi:hypothetical protein